MGTPPVKNICPFVVNDTIMLLDTYCGTCYKVAIDDATFAVDIEKIWDLKGDVDDTFGGTHGNPTMRGSTSPIHLHGSTWGCIVHDIIYDNNTVLNTVAKLAYLHTWIEFDVMTGSMTFVSRPFYLIKFGIEFVSGIWYEKKEDTIVLYMGVDDKLPMVVKTFLHDLRA